MHYLQKKSSRSAYIPWLQQLVDFGEPVEVKGRPTLEFLNCVTEITEPWHHCILIPSRRWNPFLALSEALWILAGRNDLAALKPYNSHISDYSDDGVHLYGAYGKRIYHQIDPLIERLRKDPNDRRAVLQIWDDSLGDYKMDWEPNSEYIQDLTTISKDPPCNNMVYFKLRQNKLHMTVINRSNDIHYGLFAVNLPTFGILHSYIAARLGVEMGTQTHFSNSLHVYMDEPVKAITERMLYNEPEDMPVYPEHRSHLFGQSMIPTMTHTVMAEMCSDALDEALDEKSIPNLGFLEFAADFLGQYKKHEWHPQDIRWASGHFDWILAGDIFIDKVWKKSNVRV